MTQSSEHRAQIGAAVAASWTPERRAALAARMQGKTNQRADPRLIEAARELAAEGLSSRAAAAQLSRERGERITHNTLIGLSHRYGFRYGFRFASAPRAKRALEGAERCGPLPQRAPPRPKAPKPTRRPPAVEKQFRRARINNSTNVCAPVRLVDPWMGPEFAALPGSRPRTLAALRTADCRFPVHVDGCGAETFYCAEPAEAGRSYCGAHRRMARATQ